MNMPGFTAEASVCNTSVHYRMIASVGSALSEQSLTPAFPWLRCAGACAGCIVGDGGLDCQVCMNCGVCLLGLRRCPSPWWD
jgi:hypothetical protein